MHCGSLNNGQITVVLGKSIRVTLVPTLKEISIGIDGGGEEKGVKLIEFYQTKDNN